MLGSLVIIYPAAYEGGELALRHKDREWKFDANSLTVSQPSTSLAYVAFYSDIEHEVLEVTSGRRVTITYNLYLVNPVLKPEASTVAPDLKSISNLQTTLCGLLRSPELIPSGGTLGFGLAHLYPITFEMKLQELEAYLKGEDAHVYRACRELWLQPSLRMIHDDEDSNGDYGIMLDQIVEDPEYSCYDNTYEGALIGDMGGVSVNLGNDISIESSDRGTQGESITWVSPLNERNQLQAIKRSYDYKMGFGRTYCRPCIIVPIPAASDRV